MQCDYAARRDRLRGLLIERNFDAMLVSYAANRFYLSGFELHDVQANESAGYLLVASDGRDFLLTDSRFLEAAKGVFPEDAICLYRHDVKQTLVKYLEKCGKRIALEKKSLSMDFGTALQAAGKNLAFGSGDGLVEMLRLKKDAFEVECIKQSFQLNHQMLAWLENEVQVGMSEERIAWMIESFFREHGASELAFPSIVACGKNAARPHSIPGSTTVSDNSLLLIDVGCRVREYCSDQTRTFWVGSEPSERFTRTKAYVREAQERAISAMKPGVLLADVDKLARSFLKGHGVDAAFTHGLGHGVGLETHELPSLSMYGKGELEPGMVITVEPGLYYSDWGGIRIEHTVLVGETGVTVL